MNAQMNDMLRATTPKAAYSDTEKAFYTNCLQLFASVVGKDFLDIPLLDENADTDGLFYQIPFLHSDIYDRHDKSHSLIVVYDVKNQSSTCPLRIAIEFQDEMTFEFVAIDQTDRSRNKFSMAKVDKDQNLFVNQYLPHIPLSRWVSK